MKIIKHIAAALIVVFLLYANVNLAYSTFFPENETKVIVQKGRIIPTDMQIAAIADSVFKTSSITTTDSELEWNKKVLVSGNDTLGFAYSIFEEVSCPTCSDVNVVILLDHLKSIVAIIPLTSIYESYIKISRDSYLDIENGFAGKSIINGNMNILNRNAGFKKFQTALAQSLLKIQKRYEILGHE